MSTGRSVGMRLGMTRANVAIVIEMMISPMMPTYAGEW